MHSQVLPRANLAHGTVADNQDMLRRKSGLLLDNAERRFLGQYVAAIGIPDGVEARFPFQSERRNLGLLRDWFSEADDEVADCALVQESQQRQRSGKQIQLSYRTMKVSITRRSADSLEIVSVEAATDFGVDMPQHGIFAKSLHPCPKNGVDAGFEPCFHHGFSRMPMRWTHPLAKTVVERVIQVEDYAANQRPVPGRFFPAAWRFA